MSASSEDTFLRKIYQSHQQPKYLPGTAEVSRFAMQMLHFLYPELSEKRHNSMLSVATDYNMLKLNFEALLLKNQACQADRIDSLCQSFFSGLDAVYEQTIDDSHALLSGDPAAVDSREVIRTYPGFFAIAIYRLAHLMHQLQIPYLPRIFTEFAHSETGIDIHPGATIGERFCMDHGTGIVIGETAHIGNDVKMYQGVTLGALSVSKGMAQQKRHPTIGNHVVIYAGATILGGETVIGDHSIIGGNVWITKSVPPHSKIYYFAKGNQVLK